jgi:4-methyl-5(b-hydroxyethyl)-thiazole monophosphate biosynthesis
MTDISDSEYGTPSPEMIILPGGMPGTKNLDASEVVNGAISKATELDSYIAAICAAPMILGKRGLLSGKQAVCYPGFEEYLSGATVLSDKGVVRDGKIITAAGMGAALEFGLLLVSLFKGEDYAKELCSQVIADRA